MKVTAIYCIAKNSKSQPLYKKFKKLIFCKSSQPFLTYIHIGTISHIVWIFLCYEHKTGINQIGHDFFSEYRLNGCHAILTKICAGFVFGRGSMFPTKKHPLRGAWY